ncbi:MAG: Serine/threonine-protein kinase pkn1 [bacterium ADurb.Bin363]|nr:MAG: Serine/threonine-protein kinase pkn1 [bacterium ADurb.Bin363]
MVVIFIIFSSFISEINAQTSSEVQKIVKEAETLINQGLHQEAIKKLEIAIKKDPSYAVAYYQLGKSYHAQLQYEPAIKNYKKALELQPSLAEACYNIGSCYIDIGNSGNGIKWLDQAKGIFYGKNDLEKYKKTLEKLVTVSTGEKRKVYQKELNNFPPPTVTPVIASFTPTPPVIITKTPTPGRESTDDMILISAGKFLMGSSEKDIEEAVKISKSYGWEVERSWFSDELPRHEVYLNDFYIDKYEVTNEKFKKFVLSTGYKTDAEREGFAIIWVGLEPKKISGADWQHPMGSGSSINGKMDHPVVQVSWNDACAYAVWAKKRLPTEAEWEKASRGTDGRIYPWGNTWNDNYCNNLNMNLSYLLGFMPDFFKNRGTLPAGKMSEGISPYGLMDMAGNVWEWCSDWYSKDYYNYASEENPKGPQKGEKKILKGGSWYYDNPAYLRAGLKLAEPPDSRNFMIGFRCVKDK